MRHCASVQCRSTRRSGSAACSSARFATCSAAALSPMRYRASASRLASQPCRAEPAGELATARVRSSAATPGAWPTSGSAVRASQSSIHSSIGSAGAAGSADGPQQLPGHPVRPARPPPRGHARRRGARRRAPAPASRRTAPPGSADAGTPGRGRTRPARRPRSASSTAGIRSATLRPSTMARSGTANSTPSRAAARSTSRTGPATKPRRSAMAADSEPGAEPPGQLGGCPPR